MVNYSNGKIYKIVDNTNNSIYIGSTCEPTLARRLAGHVGSYKRYLKTNKSKVTSYQILENGNFDIVLLELYPCENKDALCARERYYIESLECINKNIAGRTRQEWKTDHNDHILQYAKDHYELNKERISLYYKEYYQKKKLEKVNIDTLEI